MSLHKVIQMQNKSKKNFHLLNSFFVKPFLFSSILILPFFFSDTALSATFKWIGDWEKERSNFDVTIKNLDTKVRDKPRKNFAQGINDRYLFSSEETLQFGGEIKTFPLDNDPRRQAARFDNFTLPAGKTFVFSRSFKVRDTAGTWFLSADDAKFRRKGDFEEALLRIEKGGKNILRLNLLTESKEDHRNANGNYKVFFKLTAKKDAKLNTLRLRVNESIPEPFSTTAAVGLAIAGAAHTLKKKRTEDA